MEKPMFGAKFDFRSKAFLRMSVRYMDSPQMTSIFSSCNESIVKLKKRSLKNYFPKTTKTNQSLLTRQKYVLFGCTLKQSLLPTVHTFHDSLSSKQQKIFSLDTTIGRFKFTDSSI